MRPASPKTAFSLVAVVTVAFALAGATAPAFAQLPTPTVGWNLGNTLEPPSGEGTWGPPATQKLINGVADAGFNTVRIPCAWNSHANQTTYEIDPVFMARVKQVVDWCMARKLYVMVNCHWDGGWLENNIGVAVDPVIDAKMKSYWTQIATTFRDYDDHLLFAGANEPNADNAAKWATLRSYYNTFIAAVRATGGNNASRWLVVQGPNTNIDLSDQLVTALPDDSTPGRLAFEVHFYDPFQFTGLSSDASWGKMFYFWGKDYHSTTLASRNATWGEEDNVDSQMQKISRKFVAKGIPVIVGEFQAMKRTGNPELTGANFDLHVSSRLHFHDYVIRTAIRNGLKPIYWDIAGQLFDWTTGAVTDPENLKILTQYANSTPAYTGPKQVFFRTGDIIFTPAFSGTVTDYSAEGLPAGLSIDALTGRISGHVAQPISATITVTATGGGTTTTQPVVMNIAPDALADSRLVNISLRSNTIAGDKVATAGFSITGDKLLLARLSGPALVPFGVTGTLTQPVLKLYQGQTLLATYGAQKDSTDPAGIVQASDFAGAFSFPATGSDAAIVLPLSAGSYTFQAIGANDASGVGLIELYDLDRGAGRIVNLSTRAEVGAGGAMIDGFVVDGPAPRTFLVRAAGPALTAFGVGGALADPKLTVYEQQTKAVVATNDNWDQGQDGTAIVAANKKVSAFGFAAGSKDAAALVTLSPGSYSVVVEGANATTGVALAELYDISN
jgi:aryl-phospho-beta-D-glucosidase BglC (GH1 family)